jgi:hypothetical protein
MSNQMSGTEAARERAEQEVFNNLLAHFGDVSAGDATSEQEEGLREAARLVFSGVDAEDAIDGGWDPGEMSITKWLESPEQQVFYDLLNHFEVVDYATPEDKQGLRHAARLVLSGLDGDTVEEAIDAGWDPGEMSITEWLNKGFMENWGLCPFCKEPGDRYLNVGRVHFVVCDDCEACWLIGSNLFSSWRHESKEVWQANEALLKTYRYVDSI